jgi:pimeloyl-ACP methyl ester carboxylesterase
MKTTTKGQTMEPQSTRLLTPARIVALALIAAAIAGLAYLRFASGSHRVSVPEGAHARQLTLHDCTYGTEDGGYAAECGTLVVPENRADPHSRLIAVPVTRIRARSSHPAEPIFRLEGGPGKTNMDFARASRYAGHHDVVLVGYRGVDGSVRLDCPEVESALKHSADLLGEKSFRAYANGFRSCAARFARDGVDLRGYGIVQQVDDLEAARKALGYGRIDLLSESAGTRTALIYGWRYPRSIRRSIMIGVNPPGHFLWDGRTTDEQIRRYARFCAQDETCRGQTGDLVASMRRTGADIPKRFWFLPIKQSNVRLASFFGLMETTPDDVPANGPETVRSWLSAADGDASGFWFQSVLADMAFPKSFVWGQYAAFGRADADAARTYFSGGGHRPESNLGDAATAFIWGGGRLVDAWPAQPDEDEYNGVRRSNVETLLVGGELDFATPPRNATRELLPYLPNGHQVVLRGFGHTDSFWTQQPEAGTHLINTFFDSGKVDDSRYVPQRVDFTPDVTQTALAKGIAGAMVGLAALTVLSLAWMAVRVFRRRPWGRKAAATLRSVYAFVLGLGGWLGGVLLALTTMPTFSLDDPVLATLSIGVPVALCAYLAWLHRDRAAKDKALGLAAAAAAALAGAWLGYHAAADMLALLTAIAGAVAGANLALILLDVARVRASRNASATGTAIEMRTPSLEPAVPVAPAPYTAVNENTNRWTTSTISWTLDATASSTSVSVRSRTAEMRARRPLG